MAPSYYQLYTGSKAEKAAFLNLLSIYRGHSVRCCLLPVREIYCV